jgi:predicted alpha/beta superfamily hydrolase
MNRRDFLKLAMTTTVATLALPACQTANQVVPTVFPQSSPVLPPTITPTVKPAQVLVTIHGSEMWNMVSRSNGQEYRILTSSPRAKAGAPLPVIYITDGNGNFPLPHILHSTLVDDGYLPPALLVGVDYPFDEWSDYEALRARDFTPTVLPEDSAYASYFSAGTGGAPLFLQFLRDELKPAIDSKYNTLPGDATLTGHSLGGLLALYVLFQESNLFQRYVIGSPSIAFDNKSILNSLNTFANVNTDLPARVFMGVGGNEEFEVTDMLALADTLTSYEYSSLRLSTRVFENETHLSMIPFFLSIGLRAVFSS